MGRALHIAFAALAVTVAAILVVGCGSQAATTILTPSTEAPTSTSGSTGTTAAAGSTTASTAAGAGSSAGAATTTSLGVTETQVATRTTAAPGPAVTRSVTFVGRVSFSLLQTLRSIVNEANGDGQAVLDKVRTLSAGQPVQVGTVELDPFNGVGFAAGADSSQAIAVALVPEDGDALIFAYTLTGSPQATTIAAFQRITRRVALVVGPLPIDDAARNITTLPTAAQ